jgi:hypothetical protein
MNKKCSVCKEDKPLEFFYKAEKAKYGVMNRCKSCDALYKKFRVTETKAIRNKCYERNKETYLQRSREKNKLNRSEHLRKKLQLPDLSQWRKSQAIRAQRKLQATPVWVDSFHHARIHNVYAITQMLQEATGSIYHVDHIVPLASDEVCGLHVWWNLQPMTESANVLKHNTFDPDLYPDQGVVAFPHGSGLISAQFAVQKLEHDDE